MTNRKRTFVALLLAALATFVVSACGSDDEGSDDSSDSGGTASAEPKDIGLLEVVPAEITTRGEEAIQAASDDLGWSVNVNDPQGDPQKAVTGLSNIVTQDPDAILAAPWEATVLRQPLEQAKSNDIPVGVVWGHVTESPLYAGQYATRDEDFGIASVEALREAVPDGGEVAEFTSSGFYFGQARDEVFEDEIGSDSKYEIVATHDLDYTNAIADATKAMGDILNANPNLAAVWADSSNMIPPIVDVLKDRDLCGKVAVIGFYGDLPNLKGIRDGCVNAIIESSVEAQSYAAMDLLTGYLYDGTELPPEIPGTYPFDPNQILTITEENVPQNPKEYAEVIDLDFVKYFEDKWAEGDYGAPE